MKRGTYDSIEFVFNFLPVFLTHIGTQSEDCRHHYQSSHKNRDEHVADENLPTEIASRLFELSRFTVIKKYFRHLPIASGGGRQIIPGLTRVLRRNQVIASGADYVLPSGLNMSTTRTSEFGSLTLSVIDLVSELDLDIVFVKDGFHDVIPATPRAIRTLVLPRKLYLNSGAK